MRDFMTLAHTVLRPTNPLCLRSSLTLSTSVLYGTRLLSTPEGQGAKYLSPPKYFSLTNDERGKVKEARVSIIVRGMMECHHHRSQITGHIIPAIS